MTPHALRNLLWLFVACFLITSAEGEAARVSIQPRDGYQRARFTFDQPTQLKVEGGGSTVELQFSNPLKQSAGAIQSALGPLVKEVTISADGKTATLTLAAQARTRHFVSGPTVGVDFIGDLPSKDSYAAREEDPILSTKKPAPKTLEKAEKDKKIAAVKETAKEQKAQVLAALAKEKKDKKTASEPTKKLATTEPTMPILTTKKAATPAAITPIAAQKTPAPADKSTPAAPAVADPKPAAPLAVTVRHTEHQHIVNFPFEMRTAAAVFERANHVWIIFSRPPSLDIRQLKSVLPPAVKDAKYYDYADNTVLELVTDGSLHANAETTQNSYSWKIILSNVRADPTNSPSISSDADTGKTRLLVGAFDMAPTLKFYDPVVGDLLLISPSYEAGHGVKTVRRFPEFTILASNQGLVIASARDDLTGESSRLGLVISGNTSLAISDHLSTLSNGNAPISGGASVLLPYANWYVPAEIFNDTLMERQQALASATKDGRADALLSLATLYLGRGLGAEALGYLDLLAANEPEFYKDQKLALLTTAAHALGHHPELAAASLAAPELADVKEAELWREYLALMARKPNEIQQAVAAEVPASTPPPISLADDTEGAASATAAHEVAPVQLTGPVMKFLKYNRSFIRFYPPRIRQLLAEEAADAYLANGLEEKALAAYDTLNKDDILGPLVHRAEYALAVTKMKQKKPEEAKELLARIVAQTEDPRSRARASAMLAIGDLRAGRTQPLEAAEQLEQARMRWRGDAVEVEILKSLAKIYRDAKEYGDALRSLKTLVDEFPGESDMLTITGEMNDFFEELFFRGLADEMSPVKALSLFYEFKELTPIGEKGDLIIQRLADRLAAIDLIDRATQLLENQVNFRLSGEARSRVGARLGLLYLFNRQPEEALKVMESTNFGSNPPELKRQRQQLSAQALSAMGRHTDALNLLYNDTSEASGVLRLDIYWAAQDWPNVTAAAEEILSKRPDLTAPLNDLETSVLLKLALGYSFQGDYTQLRYLRDYYNNLVPDNGYKKIFDFISNDTTPLDKEDSALLTEQISRTENFLSNFKAKIANGRLSEAVK